MTLMSNGGQVTTDLMCEVPNLKQPVWFSDKYMPNVLSLGLLKEIYRVSYDSEKNDRAFLVHRPDRSIMRFEYFPGASGSGGLHLLQMKSNKEVGLVNTVQENMNQFSKRQIRNAKVAQELVAKVGYPSDKDLKSILKLGLLHNCPVSPNDLDNAVSIYGLSIPSMKGNTTQKTPDPVRTSMIPVPPELKLIHKDVVLGIDIMFVNRIPFLVLTAETIGFNTVDHLGKRMTATVSKAVHNIISLYKRHVFNIIRINVDNEFSKLVSTCDVPLNIISKKEHVPTIECNIRVVKERFRALRHTLPFSALPRLITVEMVKFIFRWPNAFPPSGCIPNISPCIFITGHAMDYKVHCKIVFGAYGQTNEENSPTKSIEPRTMGCITLEPDDSVQGGFYFLI